MSSALTWTGLHSLVLERSSQHPGDSCFVQRPQIRLASFSLGERDNAQRLEVLLPSQAEARPPQTQSLALSRANAPVDQNCLFVFAQCCPRPVSRSSRAEKFKPTGPHGFNDQCSYAGLSYAPVASSISMVKVWAPSSSRPALKTWPNPPLRAWG